MSAELVSRMLERGLVALAPLPTERAAKPLAAFFGAMQHRRGGRHPGCLKERAKEAGVPYHVVRWRLLHGWSEADAWHKPVAKRKESVYGRNAPKKRGEVLKL